MKVNVGTATRELHFPRKKKKKEDFRELFSIFFKTKNALYSFNEAPTRLKFSPVYC